MLLEGAVLLQLKRNKPTDEIDMQLDQVIKKARELGVDEGELKALSSSK